MFGFGVLFLVIIGYSDVVSRASFCLGYLFRVSSSHHYDFFLDFYLFLGIFGKDELCLGHVNMEGERGVATLVFLQLKSPICFFSLYLRVMMVIMFSSVFGKSGLFFWVLLVFIAFLLPPLRGWGFRI